MSESEKVNYDNLYGGIGIVVMLGLLGLAGAKVSRERAGSWQFNKSTGIIRLGKEDINIALPHELRSVNLGEVKEADLLNVLTASLPQGQSEFKLVVQHGDKNYEVGFTPYQLATAMEQAKHLDDTLTSKSFTTTLESERLKTEAESTTLTRK